jgi:hypothetical protein
VDEKSSFNRFSLPTVFLLFLAAPAFLLDIYQYPVGLSAAAAAGILLFSRIHTSSGVTDEIGASRACIRCPISIWPGH